jgi:hypothetical protein
MGMSILPFHLPLTDLILTTYCGVVISTTCLNPQRIILFPHILTPGCLDPSGRCNPLAGSNQAFVSTVSDTIPERASFFDGKLLLVGEALALIRPHLALSTNQSALHCLQLEKALKGEMTIAQWERKVLQYATRSQAMTNAFGTWFQYGGLTFMRNLLKFCWTLIAQALSKLWSI